MKKNLLLFTLFLFTHSSILACTCAYIGPFCQSITQSNSSLIVKAKVLSNQGNDLVMTLQENLVGTLAADTIQVIGQDGLNCNAILSSFSADQELILALIGPYPENTNQYHVTFCGTFLLKVTNGLVQGRITEEEPQEMSYASFLDFFSECRDFSVATTDINYLETVEVYPNPVQEVLTLRNLPLGESLKISILKTDGSLIQQLETNRNATYTFSVDFLPKGLYLVNITDGQNSITQKVVVL